LAGCAAVDQMTPLSTYESDYLVRTDGKYDTGYYSDLAMELEGDFEGILELDITDFTEQKIETLRSQSVLAIIAEKQIKFAKNQLNEKQLHLNLTAGDVRFAFKDLVEKDGRRFLVAKYSVVVETLITMEELKEEGIQVSDLQGIPHQIIVPSDPRNLLARVGDACADGFTEGSLKEDNYFYYFTPEKEGCPLKTTSEPQFTVRSLLPQDETFPEYDRLIEDQRIDIAVIFGAYAKGEPQASDWGVMMWRSYAANLRVSGWKEEEKDFGHRYTQTHNGIQLVLDLYSAYDLYRIGDPDRLFIDVLQTKEIIAYNGHSFYGSLEALDQAEAYPQNRYQILFMNSCWSYEYYTKQIFKYKQTEQDQKGWLDADVVNNTTYAYFPQMATSTRKLIDNLIAGTLNQGKDNQGRRYSWQSIIGVMNDEAKGVCPEDADPQDCRHYQPKAAHELYGVSGVITNQFVP
jgi:hypothetical protein